ncbi:hypothetical protein UK23_13125 [Lentzea aerocolonigenes]|uniref:Uncharacterized protein n=1 Tax=Lentzea aerocolonigenes TaxID=68170 RepID=A0A0F0H1R5_LENAE|nr:hypothetical protein UK23_13125 [Lentzea aerocolonigenes]
MGRNASGSPKARIAIDSTVHGPKPGNVVSHSRATTRSAAGDRSKPDWSADSNAAIVRRRDAGIASSETSNSSGNRNKSPTDVP